jgi:hypothetical protein
MKESYSVRLANHTGSESCEVVRKGGVEALTGESAGRATEPRKTHNSGTPTPLVGDGRQHLVHRISQGVRESRAVEEPGTHGHISYGNRDVPRSPGSCFPGRIGKSKDIRR